MNPHPTCCRLVFFTAILLVGSAYSQNNLIANGSFEIGDEPGEFTNLNSGSTAIESWQVVRDAIDYVGTVWVSSDGQRSVDLDGSSCPCGGAVLQTVQLKQGQLYRLQFDLAGNPVGPPVIKPMRLKIGLNEFDFQFDTTGKTLIDMGWETKKVDFESQSESTEISFESLTESSGFGAAVDRVLLILIADVNGDGVVSLLDISPFVEHITNATYLPEADVNCDGEVNLLDVAPFVDLLAGG